MRWKDELDMSAVTSFCDRWHIRELAVFGSAARDELQPGSDIDVLVTFEEGAEPDLFAFSGLARELSAFLGREVDVLTRRSVEESRNPHRRRELLASAETVYAA